MNTSIGSRLTSTNDAIAQMEIKYRRQPGSVRLLAISKTKPIEDILEAKAKGQREFGESYVQEAVTKITALADKELCWHFIGSIQKNKTKQIANHFDWVHSVDRLIIAERLNAHRPLSSPPVQICIQLNLDNEASKSGVPIEQVQGMAKSVSDLPRIKLRGLMAIPQASSDTTKQRHAFARLREQFEQLNTMGFNLDTLSMGTSGDLAAAIAEGATMVRIGTAIFGKRK